MTRPRTRESSPTRGCGAEQSSLLAVPERAFRRKTLQNMPPDTVFWTFFLMSISMSLNQGCVNSLTAIATATQGLLLGSIQIGVLYLFYLAGALFMAGEAVQRFGSKRTLEFGMCLYCIFILAFLLSHLFPFRWTFAIMGSTIGGIGASLVWTAQGVYFAEAVRVYSVGTGEMSQAVSAKFSGYFGFIYLTCELLCRFLSSFLYLFGSDIFLFTVFTAAGVLSAASMFFILNLTDSKLVSLSPSKRSVSFSQTIGLVFKDQRLLYLYPLMFTFGILSTFSAYYLNGIIITETLGKEWIGYLGCAMVGTAAAFSLLFTRVGPTWGNASFIIIGQICFALESFAPLFVPNSFFTLVPLIILFVLHGMGRFVYETVLKAVMASYFTDENLQPFAFANIVIANGLSASICFFTFPLLSKFTICMLGGCMSILGIIGYHFSKELHATKLREKYEHYIPIPPDP